MNNRAFNIYKLFKILKILKVITKKVLFFILLLGREKQKGKDIKGFLKKFEYFFKYVFLYVKKLNFKLCRFYNFIKVIIFIFFSTQWRQTIMIDFFEKNFQNQTFFIGRNPVERSNIAHLASMGASINSRACSLHFI